MIETKRDIRQRVLKCRNELSIEDRVRFSKQIQEKLLGIEEYKQADRILFFASFGTEVDLWGTIEQAWKDNKVVLLPKMIKGKEELQLYKVEKMEQLVSGQWGILEPDVTKCERIEPTRVSLVIVPGVAFDQQGNRLGYGKGYYDRLLPHISPTVKKVAVAFSIQIIDHVPTEQHDVKLDALITETGMMRFHHSDMEK